MYTYCSLFLIFFLLPNIYTHDLEREHFSKITVRHPLKDSTNTIAARSRLQCASRCNALANNHCQYYKFEASFGENEATRVNCRVGGELDFQSVIYSDIFVADSTKSLPCNLAQKCAMRIESPNVVLWAPTQNTTFMNARSLCSSDNGELAHVDSQQLADFVLDNLDLVPSEHYWIGMLVRSIPDRYEWLDGSPIGWSVWVNGQPDPELGKCVGLEVIQSADADPSYTFVVADCSQLHSAICSKIVVN